MDHSGSAPKAILWALVFLGSPKGLDYSLRACKCLLLALREDHDPTSKGWGLQVIRPLVFIKVLQNHLYPEALGSWGQAEQA